MGGAHLFHDTMTTIPTTEMHPPIVPQSFQNCHRSDKAAFLILLQVVPSFRGLLNCNKPTEIDGSSMLKHLISINMEWGASDLFQLSWEEVSFLYRREQEHETY